MVDVHEIDVLESPDADDNQPGSDVGAVVVGEGGKIWSHGRILEPYAVSGKQLTCRLHVKNNSLKKVCSIFS